MARRDIKLRKFQINEQKNGQSFALLSFFSIFVHKTRSMIKILFISLFTLLGLLPIQAQKRVGDFIESTSYNDDKRGTVRELQYVPEYDVVVCKNGNNRYTRALYGGTSAYRLETSDRPVFALFQDSRNCRNVSFRITYKGHTLALDSTTRCEARYARGQRWYRLEDKELGRSQSFAGCLLSGGCRPCCLAFLYRGIP